MGDFTPIETQEQLDAVIGERIKRERETSAKKYEGYLSPDDFKSKTADYEKQIGELTNALKEANDKAANHEKEIADRVSREHGVSGDDVEKDIQLFVEQLEEGGIIW